MRHLPPAETLRAARLAIAHQGHGVIAFDLAGAEFGHPPGEHQAALALVRDAGLALTLHAGEADAAERVLEAARLGATRIGHGVRLADAIGDPARQALVEEAIERGIHLEVCPSSNVHTGAARSIAEHPIVALWRAGVSLSFHTDNRLMSRTSASQEAQLLLAHTTLSVDDLVRMELEAVRHSFLDADVRAAAGRAIEAWRNATVIKPASA
jgi:adenosine deaminase